MQPVTTFEKKWIRLAIVLIASLIVYVGLWWRANPIGLHRQVQVAGITVKVPFGWVENTMSSRVEAAAYLSLRRAYVPWMSERPWMSGMIDGGTRRGEPYTVESARKAQAWFAALYGDRTQYSNSRTFELSSRKYSSLCAEGTMHDRDGIQGAQVLNCFVVGTPLMASFMSPQDVDGDAERILSSLN